MKTTTKLKQLKNNLPRNIVENPDKNLPDPEKTIDEAINKLKQEEKQ